MRYLAVALVVLAPCLALADGPYLGSDPNPSAVGGYAEITGPPWLPVTSPLDPDGSVHVDLATAPVGTWSIQIRACITDEWNRPVCSDYVPFVYTPPARPSAFSGVVIEK